MRSFLGRWQGILLALIAIAATLWLGATGQLGLYIHPRYIVFTVIMALIGAVLAIAGFAMAPRADDHDGHDHDDPAGRSPRSARRRALLRTTAGVVLIAAAGFSLLVLPPSALTATTAEQRPVNSSLSASSAGVDTALKGADPSTFTVKDWSLFLRMGVSTDFLADNPAKVVGFVSPDPNDADNVFYVTRYSITCCAVDATPVGLAVYLPDWQKRFAGGDWVQVSGILAANPSTSSAETLAIVPETSELTDPPSEEYVY